MRYFLVPQCCPLFLWRFLCLFGDYGAFMLIAIAFTLVMGTVTEVLWDWLHQICRHRSVLQSAISFIIPSISDYICLLGAFTFACGDELFNYHIPLFTPWLAWVLVSRAGFPTALRDLKVIKWWAASCMGLPSWAREAENRGLPSLQSHPEDLKELKLKVMSHLLLISILKTRNICTCKLTP